MCLLPEHGRLQACTLHHLAHSDYQPVASYQGFSKKKPENNGTFNALHFIDYMKPDTLLACVQAFDKLVGTKYIIHLGRAVKLAKFTVTFEKEDCFHLMGLHYLQDRRDNRNRAVIFDELLTNPKYRHRIASSKHWNDDLEGRVACTTILEKLLDNNITLFRYNPRRLFFQSHIKAEYLMACTGYAITPDFTSEVYLFLDKRKPDSDTSDRFCKSIFSKRDHDFMEYQAKWTLLYKEKIVASGVSAVLYQHKGYTP